MIPDEIGWQLVKLGLFDIEFHLDDSGSMAFHQDGKRITELTNILEFAADAASVLDDDGFRVTFINSKKEGTSIKSAGAAMDLLKGIEYRGMTDLAISLENKILRDYKQRKPEKPVLVIVITDGIPSNSTHNGLERNIKQAHETHKADIFFQFAKVGDDSSVDKFLTELDTTSEVKDIVDTISGMFHLFYYLHY